MPRSRVWRSPLAFSTTCLKREGVLADGVAPAGAAVSSGVGPVRRA